MAAATLNKNNSAVKRIMQEARELANDPCTDYSAAPLEDDIFEWHCTLRGPAGTDFEGGLYHFRILLPAEYPFRPPSLMMLTPNGRFELNTKICISFTNYHEELWQPAWGVRTAIIGLQGFFPLKGQNAVGVGSIEYPSNERRRLAALSREWVCPHCDQSNLELLPDPPTPSGPSASVDMPPASASETLSPTPPPADTNIESEMDVTPIESVPSSESASDHLPADISESLGAVHSIDALLPGGGNGPAGINRRPTAFIARAPGETAGADAAQRSPHKPPILLDTAICVLLVLAVAMICRRVL